MSTPVSLDTFVGPPVHALTHDGIAFYDNAYQVGQVIPLHVHAEPVLSLVLAGEGVEEVGSRTRTLVAQDLLYTPSHAPHGYRFGIKGQWFNIQLSDDWLARKTDGRALPATAEIVRGNAASVWAARVRSEVRLHDAVSNLAIEGAMILMIAELARLRDDGAPTRPRWLNRVEEAIDATSAAPLSMNELSAIAGVHPRHLLRTFRKYHGTTVATYVRQRQLQHAREAIATSTHPLAMVALDAGFADQSHLTRAFRKAYGETPAEYSRSIRSR
jgi:AraC family transcriptional regulator